MTGRQIPPSPKEISAAKSRIDQAGDDFLRRFVNFWIAIAFVAFVTATAIWQFERPYAVIAVLSGGMADCRHQAPMS